MKNINSKLYAIFVFFCISIFLYEAFHCTNDFLNQTPFSQISVENLELYPLPSICVQPIGLLNTDLHNLTLNGYRKEGTWRSALWPGLDDEQNYSDLSTSFEDLVEKVVLDREISPGSEAYNSITLTSSDHGLLLQRCDYYYDLKCFCLNFSPTQISFGIQRIDAFMKRDSKISIVAPHNFFSLKSKQTRFSYQIGFENSFNLHHSISKFLPLPPNPCSADIFCNNCNVITKM